MKKTSSDSTQTTQSTQGDGASGEERVILVTKDGFDKLGQELEYLKGVKRREVAERLQEAISYGDLSENSEYEDAKNEQAFVEGRVLELEDKIKHAKVIEEKGGKKAVTVQLGSKVFIKQAGRQTVQEFTIVGSTEADPTKHRISNVSPVGAAVMDARVGDTIKVPAPIGVIEYEIMKIE